MKVFLYIYQKMSNEHQQQSSTLKLQNLNHHRHYFNHILNSDAKTIQRNNLRSLGEQSRNIVIIENGDANSSRDDRIPHYVHGASNSSLLALQRNAFNTSALLQHNKTLQSLLQQNPPNNAFDDKVPISVLQPIKEAKERVMFNAKDSAKNIPEKELGTVLAKQQRRGSIGNLIPIAKNEGNSQQNLIEKVLNSQSSRSQTNIHGKQSLPSLKSRNNNIGNFQTAALLPITVNMLPPLLLSNNNPQQQDTNPYQKKERNQVLTRLKIVQHKTTIPPESILKYHTIGNAQEQAQLPTSFFKTSKFPRNQSIVDASNKKRNNEVQFASQREQPTKKVLNTDLDIKTASNQSLAFNSSNHIPPSLIQQQFSAFQNSQNQLKVSQLIKAVQEQRRRSDALATTGTKKENIISTNMMRYSTPDKSSLSGSQLSSEEEESDYVKGSNIKIRILPPQIKVIDSPLKIVDDPSIQQPDVKFETLNNFMSNGLQIDIKLKPPSPLPEISYQLDDDSPVKYLVKQGATNPYTFNEKSTQLLPSKSPLILPQVQHLLNETQSSLGKSPVKDQQQLSPNKSQKSLTNRTNSNMVIIKASNSPRKSNFECQANMPEQIQQEQTPTVPSISVKQGFRKIEDNVPRGFISTGNSGKQYYLLIEKKKRSIEFQKYLEEMHNDVINRNNNTQNQLQQAIIARRNSAIIPSAEQQRIKIIKRKR
ncbi:hypothetical protein FGO68_gene206 [Halteria grandinella]|uniref:Uncharacterized protein n=1 Tax=Halteria grandinella TaxID=5974 RepID=A0A8J8NTZ6_HALGN|nr:hypothetical protein FGO68_gene206 [Halteria grandinella]